MMDSFEEEERFHRSSNVEDLDEEVVVGSMEEMQATDPNPNPNQI